MKNTLSHRGSSATHSAQLVEGAVSAAPGTPAQVIQTIVSLSDSQEQALEWLIGGGSIGEAAQFAGVTRQTVSRWLHTDPDFRAVYDQWKLEASQMLEGRLVAAGESAMDNLLDAVRMKRDVKASQFVIRSLLDRLKQRRE
jgi:hypothetical protein